MLPPAACKRCIYWFRAVVGSAPDSWYQQFTHCPRCGIAQWELLAELNQRLLGISTPHETRDREPITAAEAPQQPGTGNARLDKWLSLYQSRNPDVQIRAAKVLIGRADTPLPILLHILDKLSHQGLGAAAERALLHRRGSDLVNAMIARLNSSNEFIRQVACNVLGHSADTAATPHLLRMIDDPHVMVRRAAGFALAHLKDLTAVPGLKRQYAARRDDDINVVWALQTALQSLGVDTENIK